MIRRQQFVNLYSLVHHENFISKAIALLDWFVFGYLIILTLALYHRLEKEIPLFLFITVGLYLLNIIAGRVLLAFSAKRYETSLYGYWRFFSFTILTSVLIYFVTFKTQAEAINHAFFILFLPWIGTASTRFPKRVNYYLTLAVCFISACLVFGGYYFPPHTTHRSFLVVLLQFIVFTSFIFLVRSVINTLANVIYLKQDRIINEILTQINTERNLQKVMRMIAQAIKTFGFDRARIYVLQDNKKVAECVEIIGDDGIDIQNLKYRVESDPYTKNTLEQGEPVIYKKGQLGNQQLMKHLKKEDVEEWVEIPIISGDERLGLICIDNKYTKRAIQKGDTGKIGIFIQNAAVAIKFSQFWSESQFRTRQLQEEVGSHLQKIENINRRDKIKSALMNIAQKAATTRDYIEIASSTLTEAINLVGAQFGHIRFLNPQRSGLELISCFGGYDEIASKHIGLNNMISGFIFSEKKISDDVLMTDRGTQVVGELHKVESFTRKIAQFRRRKENTKADFVDLRKSMVGLILRSQVGQKWGILSLQSDSINYFTKEHADLLEEYLQTGSFMIEEAWRIYQGRPDRLNEVLNELLEHVSISLDWLARVAKRLNDHYKEDSSCAIYQIEYDKVKCIACATDFQNEHDLQTPPGICIYTTSTPTIQLKSYDKEGQGVRDQTEFGKIAYSELALPIHCEGRLLGVLYFRIQGSNIPFRNDIGELKNFTTHLGHLLYIRNQMRAAIGTFSHQFPTYVLGVIKNAYLKEDDRIFSSEELAIIYEHIEDWQKNWRDALEDEPISTDIKAVKVCEVMHDCQILVKVCVYIGDLWKDVNFVYENTEEEPAILVNKHALLRIITSLLDNALAFRNMEGESKVVFSAIKCDSKVRFCVSNVGDRIPDEVITRMYDPGYSTRMSHLGFGLAYAKKLVQGMKGDLFYTHDSDALTNIFIIEFDVV